MPKIKCDVCHQQKGKRACPARDGHWICPQCCAENRVKVFACPPTCAYLGGEGSLRLAESRQEAFTPPPAETVRVFLDELILGVKGANLISDVEPAALSLLAQIGELSRVEGAAEVIDAALFEWVAMGARGAQGERLLDRAVLRVNRPLSAVELDALEALHRSHYRLLRVEETLDADRLRTTDLLSESALEVSAPGLAERFSAGKSLGASVTPTAEGSTILLGALALPEESEPRFVRRIGELHEASPLKDAPRQEFLTRCSLVIPLLLHEHFAASAPAERDPLDEPPQFL